jgi:aryl-alcohol dehydrogenase-like predicted oxidoreductase
MGEKNIAVVEQLAVFCAERGRTMVQHAFGWLLSRSCVASIIAGATSPEQVQQNADALGWQMTSDELAAIDRIAGGDDAEPSET